MDFDPHDELARRRTLRNRDRSVPHAEGDDRAQMSAEQEAAIARARESWMLSQMKGDEAAPQSPSESD